MRISNYLATLTVAILCLASSSRAQEPSVQQTTHTVPSQPPGAKLTETIQFSQQPAKVGDRVAQTVEVQFQVHTTITQAGQQANESNSSLKRSQQRFVEVLEVEKGRVRRAHVAYPLSRLTASQESSTTPENHAEETVQAVEQKSYYVTRDGKSLLVTDSEGAIPPQAEYEIVATSMQNLGLPNPMIKFLLGRTVRVGERLQLPQEIAEQLMGWGEDFGKISQFQLELKSVQEIEGQRCGVFAATIEAVGEPTNPVRLRAFGQVVIQAETCRTVRAELAGPLTLSTVEHTPAGNFQYAARGQMQVAIRSQYGHARQ